MPPVVVPDVVSPDDSPEPGKRASLLLGRLRRHWWFWMAAVEAVVVILWGAGALQGDSPQRVPWWDRSWHYTCLHPLHYLAQHGFNLVIGLGAGGAALGVGAGAVLGAVYGRRGSVSVSAVVYSTPAGVVAVARPCAKAVGLFRLSFHKDGVGIWLTEVYIADGQVKEGRTWPGTGSFGEQYVDANEELFTTVMFDPIDVPSSVIGWRVLFALAARGPLARFRTSLWKDQVFVAKSDLGTIV